MYVCMSVRNGFTTEVYEITYGLRTLRHVRIFFFWTHFRLGLRTTIHMRMRSATPSVYLDL